VLNIKQDVKVMPNLAYSVRENHDRLVFINTIEESEHDLWKVEDIPASLKAGDRLEWVVDGTLSSDTHTGWQLCFQIQPHIEIASCASSENGYHCSEAFDGITVESANGWALEGVPALGEFRLEGASDVYGLSMLTGVQNTDTRIQEFEIQCQVGDAFVDVTNVRISPGIDAAITGNKVSMTAGHQDVRVDFDTIENCIGVKIWVYATDAGNNNLVMNELTVYGILASEKWSECSASCGRKGIQTRGLETKPCNQINCHFCSFNDDDCIVGFKCNNGNCEIDQGEIDLGEIDQDFVSYVMLDSDGQCAPGTGLTEEECQNLGDGGIFSIWGGASTWSLPETCGCYIDQDGGRYFNRLTGACDEPDAGEKMICKEHGQV